MFDVTSDTSQLHRKPIFACGLSIFIWELHDQSLQNMNIAQVRDTDRLFQTYTAKILMGQKVLPENHTLAVNFSYTPYFLRFVL